MRLICILGVVSQGEVSLGPSGMLFKIKIPGFHPRPIETESLGMGTWDLHFKQGLVFFPLI